MNASWTGIICCLVIPLLIAEEVTGERKGEFETIETNQAIAEVSIPEPHTEKSSRSMELKTATALLLGFALIPVAWKISNRQKLSMIKKRFADDLEEEIETSLQTIALLSKLAAEPHNTRNDQENYMKRIHRLSIYSSGAIQHLSDLNDSKFNLKSLRNEIERTTERILSQTNYSLDFFGESYLNKLSALSQMGLFLFYKEHLTNTVTHTSPSRIGIKIRATAKETIIEILEEGLLGIVFDELSPTLHNRARLIGAKISLENEGNHHSTLILTLPSNKWGIF